jgi:hypothetical protein
MALIEGKTGLVLPGELSLCVQRKQGKFDESL